MKNHVLPQPGLKDIQPYKPGRPIEEVQKQFGIRDVIKLASNENPIGASPAALTKIVKMLPQINLYPDGSSQELRNAIAAKLNVFPDEIIVGNGADGVILETCIAYLDNDDEVITSMSSFPIYDIYACAMRARLIKTPLTNDFGLDLDAMLKAVTLKTKIIFVCNPNNPTGTVLLREEVDDFIKKIPENILVVLDEAYYEYIESDLFPDSIQYIREGKPNILVLRTFSKIYGLAGLRIGYGIGISELLQPLYSIKEPFSVNRLAQTAGIAAMEDAEFVNKTLETTRIGKEYLYGQFEKLGLFFIKSHTNFIMVDLGSQGDRVIEKLLENGVIVRPGKGYDLPGFARITIGSPAQNQRLVELLENMVVSVSK